MLKNEKTNTKDAKMIKNVTAFRKYIKNGRQFKVRGVFDKNRSRVNSPYDKMIGAVVAISCHKYNGFFINHNSLDYWVQYPWGIGFSCEKWLDKTVVLLCKPGHYNGSTFLALELVDE